MKIPGIALAVLVFASFAGGALAQESSVISELRDSLFQAADGALEQANAEKGALLSPTNYADATEYYRKAESRLNAGGSIETIRRDLERATASFLKAAEQGKLAQTTFQTTISARDDAMNAGAESYASDEWMEAERTFADAAVRLEKGRLERAQGEGVEAEKQYRAAELTAIKGNYLSETRSLLEQAREVRADRYAAKSYEGARRQLKEAETSLNENRYDTDQPRSLAQGAKHSALHAIYVAKLEQAIRDKDLTLEDILLDWEASIQRIADLVDIPVHFDEGQEAAVIGISEAVTKMIAENRRLESTLNDRQVQLDTLIQETASMERLSKLVARQERQKQRLAKVEALFNSNEATVLRQQESIILRMIGLNFDSAKAELKPEHELLLNSLRQALAEFPESNIVIEGHTDAFGSDSDNLVLSQKRAEALQQYLLANSPISPVNLTALGYGESRPVANNESVDGRKKNRRIDVVIYPKW